MIKLLSTNIKVLINKHVPKNNTIEYVLTFKIRKWRFFWEYIYPHRYLITVHNHPKPDNGPMKGRPIHDSSSYYKYESWLSYYFDLDKRIEEIHCEIKSAMVFAEENNIPANIKLSWVDNPLHKDVVFNEPIISFDKGVSTGDHSVDAMSYYMSFPSGEALPIRDIQKCDGSIVPKDLISHSIPRTFENLWKDWPSISTRAAAAELHKTICRLTNEKTELVYCMEEQQIKAIGIVAISFAKEMGKNDQYFDEVKKEFNKIFQ